MGDFWYLDRIAALDGLIESSELQRLSERLALAEKVVAAVREEEAVLDSGNWSAHKDFYSVVKAALAAYDEGVANAPLG